MEQKIIELIAEKLCKKPEQVTLTSRLVEDLGAEVTDQEKVDIEEKSKKLEEALKGSNIEEIKKYKEELTKASQNIAMRAYQKAQQANQASQNNDDVVDAEFVDPSDK